MYIWKLYESGINGWKLCNFEDVKPNCLKQISDVTTTSNSNKLALYFNEHEKTQ